MACQECGKQSDGLHYTCNFCGKEHCSDHRLPEAHNCRNTRTVAGDSGVSSKSTTNLGSGSYTGIVFALAILVLLVSAAHGFANPINANPIESVDSKVSDFQNFTSEHTEQATADKGFNETKAELEIHRLINKERTERGLSKLAYDDDLGEIAKSHSKDMATNGFFSHTSPTTGEFDDRYRSAGYTCKVRISENQYATGGENIAQTWYKVSLQTSGDDFLTSEKEVAAFIVSQWMKSPGHRKNILRPYWENEGIGIYTIEKDEGLAVYATQNFC